MEVKLDNMLVKSAQASEHVGDLKGCFDALKQYQMKLNLEKWAF